MHLTFDPAICQLSTLVLPVQAGQYDLRFKATFDSRAAYEQARRDGTRVEMWTELPVAGTAYEGGWRALTFQFEEDEGLMVARSKKVGNEESVLTISPSAKMMKGQYGEEKSVYLNVRLSSENIVPAFPGAEVKFAFTYRLLFPSGNVQWLGEYRHNGMLLIRRGETRLQYARSVNCEDELEVVCSQDGPSEEVGHLSDDLLWESWAAGKTGRPILSPTYATAPSSSVLLIPRLHQGKHSIVVPQPLHLTASSGCSIIVSSSGVISTHTSEDTPSKVFFSSGDHAQDTFLSSLRGSTQVVKYDSESGFVILASIADEDEEVVLPITLSFIPISSKSQHATHASLSATLRAFASLLPPSTEDEREIVLYHKRLGVISCVSVPSSISSELINLRVSSSGDQVVLAPLYTLPSKEEHIEKEDPWKVSYLTPHGPVKVLSQTPEEKVKEPPSSLLTPPPSPSFRHSFRMPEIETVLESQSQSFEIPQEAAETPEVQDHDASDDVGMAVPDAVESSTEDTPSNVTVEELSVDDIDDEIAPREPAPPLSASSISGHITSIVVRVVQEVDKRVGLRAARSMFPCRSAFRFLLDFSVHVMFTRLFGALGFVLAFIGWRKHDLRIRGTKEPQSERIQEVMEVMEVPDDADETTPITENPPEQPAEAQVEAEEEMVSSSSIAEESISASDDAREDAQSEATVVEDDIEKHIPDPSSPELPGAFGPDDTPEGELLPPRLSTRLHTKLAALLLRSPFSSPDSPPTEITITLNGKPVSALYHKIASQDRGVPFHLFEFTASTNGGNVEVSSE